MGNLPKFSLKCSAALSLGYDFGYFDERAAKKLNCHPPGWGVVYAESFSNNKSFCQRAPESWLSFLWVAPAWNAPTRILFPYPVGFASEEASSKIELDPPVQRSIFGANASSSDRGDG